VAEVTGKRHADVLQDIDSLRDKLTTQGGDFHRVYFQEDSSPHPTVSGQSIHSFRMTRDGMALLVLGYRLEQLHEHILKVVPKAP
jgi:phage regulator Rha-like protein